ncbi:MAG: hypothetical protein JNK79_04615 [Chitinophagaceae bacterium]|nr:hypothetical protein [Chitinophagaceae bacterium]
MKQSTSDKYLSLLANVIVCSALLFSIFMLNSFSVHRIGDDFMKQLGISKNAADEKITQSIIGGSLDAYGLKNIKNVLAGDRGQITKDLLVYTKQHVASEAFKKEYETLRQNNKPKKDEVKTPAEIKAEHIAAIKKMITTSQEGLKTANSTMKPIYENMLAEGKKQLAEAESPNNKYFTTYEKNYPQMLKTLEANHEALLKDWEKIYPAEPSQFIKRRLEEFLNETGDIDYSAEVVSKNGRKYFVRSEYENKGNRWKMAFRAGKEVVEPARAFVQQWIAEIK